MRIDKLFHFHFDKEAATALVSGAVMLLLSIAMNFFPDHEIAQVLLRDVLMIFVLGFVFPICFVLFKKRESLSLLGIHKQRLKTSIMINVLFAAALLVMFMKGNENTITFDISSFFAVTYIFAAGIFEMLFIYGFLRYEFERAFGIIPAILLTAAFYSLHHAGFQPEFSKLFFVGIMYVAVFYITRNIFVIFPFFWGVGAVWDVLVNSDAGRAIENKQSFVIAVILLAGMMITAAWVYQKKSGKEKRTLSSRGYDLGNSDRIDKDADIRGMVSKQKEA